MVSSCRLVLRSLIAVACLVNSRAVADTPPASYIIQTVAGSDASGDGGSALSAALSQPEGIAVDRSGNVYVADAADHRVRKIAPMDPSKLSLEPASLVSRATADQPMPRCSISLMDSRSIGPATYTSPTWATRACAKYPATEPSIPWPAEASCPPLAPDKAAQLPARN